MIRINLSQLTTLDLFIYLTQEVRDQFTKLIILTTEKYFLQNGVQIMNLFWDLKMG